MVKDASTERRPHALLPIMGLVVAIAIGIVAYFLSPILLDIIRDQMGVQSYERRLGRVDDDTLRYIFSGLLWLILFSICMMIVAVAIGEDPEEEARLVKPALSRAKPKEVKKYLKGITKIEDRRVKQLEEKQQREAEAARKRGGR